MSFRWSTSQMSLDRKARSVGVVAIGHLQSLLVDSNFFYGVGIVDGDDERVVEKSGDEQRLGHHWHNNSMDGSSTMLFKVDSTMVMMDGVKKAMTLDKLFELALIDPKRATSILADRQSAARSKERKIRYAIELMRKVQRLRTKATNLSAEVNMLERETTNMPTRNKELKMHLEALREEERLREDLRQAIKEEVQRLREETSRLGIVGYPPFN
ncbi:Transcription factor VIP1 [Spatholobus suberectus]|nr:Transcription factor VIP1 [Spatholobus suberectus]